MDDKYKYSYLDDGNYCYKNTNVLKNKLNIKNEQELYDKERKLVSLRISELFDNPIKGNFNFAHLKKFMNFYFKIFICELENLELVRLLKRIYFVCQNLLIVIH